MPWMDANGISIHFKLGGQGPSVVLLHEMGGTLDSWDGIFPALSERFRTLRYDQRGHGQAPSHKYALLTSGAPVRGRRVRRRPARVSGKRR